MAETVAGALRRSLPPATLVAAAPLALSDVSGEVLNSTRSVTASQF